jgi:hypothetical protein
VSATRVPKHPKSKEQACRPPTPRPTATPTEDACAPNASTSGATSASPTYAWRYPQLYAHSLRRKSQEREKSLAPRLAKRSQCKKTTRGEDPLQPPAENPATGLEPNFRRSPRSFQTHLRMLDLHRTVLYQSLHEIFGYPTQVYKLPRWVGIQSRGAACSATNCSAPDCHPTTVLLGSESEARNARGATPACRTRARRCLRNERRSLLCASHAANRFI